MIQCAPKITKIKDLTALSGALGDIPSQVNDSNILEDVAAAIPNSGSLVSGSTNFLNNNLSFGNLMNFDFFKV